MQALIVGKKEKETNKLLSNAKNAAKDFKEIKVVFIQEKDDSLYELPLVVVNNVIVSSGSILSEEELKEIFKNPPQGCLGACGSCGRCL